MYLGRYDHVSSSGVSDAYDCGVSCIMARSLAPKYLRTTDSRRRQRLNTLSLPLLRGFTPALETPSQESIPSVPGALSNKGD